MILIRNVFDLAVKQMYLTSLISLVNVFDLADFPGKGGLRQGPTLAERASGPPGGLGDRTGAAPGVWGLSIVIYGVFGLGPQKHRKNTSKMRVWSLGYLALGAQI